MKTENAIKQIESVMKNMDECYGNCVFDEWALLSLRPGAAAIIHYHGPRTEDFRNSFPQDISSLKTALTSNQHGIGDFEFNQQAEGTLFDAFLVVGVGLHLICNNTEKSMEELTADIRWREAQKPFVLLSEEVRSNPVTLPRDI